jgi:rod shape-determining protein MreC
MPFLNKVSWSESQQLSQLFPTYKENATLKNELATESQAEANVYKIKHKNKELTELLKVQNGMTAYNPISATVIDRSISNWDNELIIDKGAKRGIKVDMNVLNSNGVIGKVAKVFS